MKTYVVKKCAAPPEMTAAAGEVPQGWKAAAVGKIAKFHAKSSGHHPGVEFRVLHDDENLYVRFDVKDRYVKSVNTEYQSATCLDSCVEFFVEPPGKKGYFNFEVNAGGTALIYHVIDPSRSPVPNSGLSKVEKVAETWLPRMEIRHSLPPVVDPEIEEPTDWAVCYKIPFALMEEYTGEKGIAGKAGWRANFFKCADKTSHPHWGYWNEIGEELNYHQPAKFGKFELGA